MTSGAIARAVAWLGAAVLVAVPLAGCASSTAGRQHRSPAPTKSSKIDRPSGTARAGAIPPLAGGPTGPAHADSRAASPTAVPVRIRIPSIGVDSALQHLRLDTNGTLQTPSQWQVAGWYAGGVRPGDVGPAVVAGHVDSVSGPAVFYRLRQLRRGAAVLVRRADGTTARFIVAGTAEYPKRRFPTEAVYGPAAVPTLRLVTCGGDFDTARRSYVDNLVVTAYLG